MGRSPCCSKEGLNRGAWNAHEDKILREYIKVHGEGKWRNLPSRAGLKRCGKSCRLRWLNYLRPDIKRGNISSDEEELIIRLHKLLGNRWSLIAGRLPGRTDNEIKNYWNSNLGKKLKHGKLQPTNCCQQLSNGNKTQNPIATSLSLSLSLSQDSKVVRTKATKCAKVVFLLPTPEAEEDKAKLADAYANDNGFLSFPNQEKDLSTDLLTDFNVEDMCLSELLSSDFGCDDVKNDQPDATFSDEPLKDWTQSNFTDEANASNYINSLISFLESNDERQ